MRSASANASFFHAGNRLLSWSGKDHYLGKIQPILAKRCAVCHACSDSPCSLKLTSYEGFQRGASQINPYAVRVGEINFPSDKPGAKDFYAVHSPKFNESLFFQFLKLGQEKKEKSADQSPSFKLGQSKPQKAKGPDAATQLQELHDSATFVCPKDLPSFEKFALAYPDAGMPYNMSKLEKESYQDLLQWLSSHSAKGPSPEALSELRRPSKQRVVHAWEMFLNGRDKREQLVARYLFEHLFSARIVFDEMPGEFFEIVRSSSAPAFGDPDEFVDFEELETPLATDAPPSNGRPFFYRIKKITEVITQKNNIVFKLNLNKVSHYRNLFLSPKNQWTVTSLPAYKTTDVFQNFAQIPEVIRYRFMLENARYIVDAMVRAPVCKGESATFAIADHFWAFFIKPESDVSAGASPKMSAEGFRGLDLQPSAWTAVGQIEDRFVRNYQYMNAYEDALRQHLKSKNRSGLSLDDIWFGEPLIEGGESNNRNAWLSITRHDFNTTVQYGHEGGMPQSLWLLNYANFERLYYNLVVNFKYWGDMNHKLSTWRSMSHERMDGEDLFLSLLPNGIRNAIRDEWSGGLTLSEDLGFLAPAIAKLIKFKTDIKTKGPIKRYIDLYPLQSLRGESFRPTEVKLRGDGPPLYDITRQIRDRMKSAGVITKPDDLNSDRNGENILDQAQRKSGSLTGDNPKTIEDWERKVKLLVSDRGQGRYAPFVPAITWVRVTDGSGQSFLYSLIGNRGYKSHNISLLSSAETSSPVREIGRDTISVYRGIVGDYPQLFLDISLEKNGNEFLQLVQSMNDQNHNEKSAMLRSQFGIDRNSSKFWPFVDWLHDWMVRNETDFGPGLVYAGIVDLSKYGYR